MTMPSTPPDPADRPLPPPSSGGTWSGMPPDTPGPRPGPQGPYVPPPRRPGTVTAAAVILYVSAGLSMLACCVLGSLAGDVPDELSNLLTLAVVLLLGGAVLNVVLAYFVLEGRQWAQIATIVLCGLGIVVSVLQLLANPEAVGASGCLGILINALIIFLLSTEDARAYFRQSG